MTLPTALVIDASVALKWFFPEEHSESARALLASGAVILAPEFLRIEVAAVAAKKVRRHEITPSRARVTTVRITEIVNAGFRPTRPLAALDIALKHQISAYDATYVATALEEAAPFVTADRRLYNALAPALPETMLWVGDAAVKDQP